MPKPGKELTCPTALRQERPVANSSSYCLPHLVVTKSKNCKLEQSENQQTEG